MTRISENSMVSSLLTSIMQNQQSVQKYGQEVSSGLKVSEPGDSTFSGTISQLQSVLQRVSGYQRTVSTAKGVLTNQDDILNMAAQVLVRAKEVAAQGGNETNSATERFALSEEVLQLRDQMVNLANTKYQGSYVFSGAAANTPAYSPAAYANGDGAALQRYEYTSAPGNDLTKEVKIGDNLSVTINTPGNQIFDNAIQALERLGRALRGFKTDPAVGAPSGTGAAYDLPAESAQQTLDIKAAMDLLDRARQTDIETERVSVAGRLTRLETAASLLTSNSQTSKEALSTLQDADMAESATKLSLSQTALQASMSVTVQALNLSILKYL